MILIVRIKPLILIHNNEHYSKTYFLVYSNTVKLVFGDLKHSRGLLTPQSALFIFHYASTKHIITILEHIPFHVHITQLLILRKILNYSRMVYNEHYRCM